MSNDTPANEHSYHETVEVSVYYPDHEKRVETDLYKKTHHTLIIERNTPCYICGTLEKREVHHFYVEYSYQNAVDWNKLKAIHPEFRWDQLNKPSDFTDSLENMMVLCELHHRHHDFGIHMVPFPIWQIQKIQRNDFVYAPLSTTQRLSQISPFNSVLLS